MKQELGRERGRKKGIAGGRNNLDKGNRAQGEKHHMWFGWLDAGNTAEL